MVAPNILSIIIAVFLTHRIVYQFTYTKQKAPDNSEVYMSLQNCGSFDMELASCHPSGA
jgi:hypothetical protein